MEFKNIIEYLKGYDGVEVKLMEVCGTHTNSIFAHGIRSFLSPKIKLLSGPGCPVCVTPKSYIDEACRIATLPNHILYTFGDMMKVPGEKSLEEIKALGGKVEILYSPLDIIEQAQNRKETLVLTAVGFETTAPLYALLCQRIKEEKMSNIRLLTSLKAIIPALDFLGKSGLELDGLLCPGNVSIITGEMVYKDLQKKLNKPLAIAGFSAEHLLIAIYYLVKQIEEQSAGFKNFYPTVVTKEGNTKAQELLKRNFSKKDSLWRGLGVIPESGYYFQDESLIFPWSELEEKEACHCGEVMLGKIQPPDCSLFNKVCTPKNPKGPCMVAKEGSCGIWYHNL